MGMTTMIDFEYQVIRSKRKSVQMSLHPEGTVLIRCPESTPDEYIRKYVDGYAGEIRKYLSRHPQIPATERAVLTDANIARLKADIPGRVTHYSEVMGVTPDAVQITSAHKRWACCIRRGKHHKLCFSYRVMLLSEELRDFVVKHELAHITEIRHTPAFFALLAKYEPNHYNIADQVKRQEALVPYYAGKQGG